jgi:hypothetical protein
MRRSLLLALALVTGSAPEAVRAAALPVEVDLRIQIAATPTFGVSGTGTAEVTSTGVHLTALSLASGLAAGTGVVMPVTDPAAAPIMGYQVTIANGAAAFAETSGGELAGTMPILGVAKVCLFAPCSAALSNLSLPLTPIGVGGTAVGAGPVSLTLRGAPWTSGDAVILPGYYSTPGFRHGPASLTSSTAQPGGEMRLVTPIFISTNIGVGVTLESYAFLDVRFVPEPSAALLLSVGALGLAIRGRAARRWPRLCADRRARPDV